MGGRPRYLLVSLGLPPRTPLTVIDGWYRGLRRLLARERVALIGGDTSAATCFHVALTAIGEIDPARAVTRAGARPGDCLLVTGTLGEAAAGLHALKHGRQRAARELIRRHHYPEPRLAAGRALAEHRFATAMLDLSDGLLIDLDRLCEASGVGAELLLDRLPLSAALIRYTESRTRARSFALAGGEDYELLFTVRPGEMERCLRLLRRMRVPCRCIGRIISKRPGRAVRCLEQGRPATRVGRRIGYEHFSVSR